MTSRLLPMLLLLAAAAQAQPPTVNPGGILNHFSFATPGLPNGSLAQGSIFDIYGTNIGPAELAQASGFPLPAQLAGTSVQVTVAGTSAVSSLDAGAVVTVRGPGGIRPLARQSTGHFAILGTTPVPGVPAQQGPPYLVPGAYTVDNGGGGPDVPAFTASVNLPNEFTWTNASPNLAVGRAEGFEFTWSGGDSTGWVDIAGTSTLPRVTGQSTAGGYFSCRVRASAGRLRIGPEILLHLPPSFTLASGDPSGVISVSNTFTSTPLQLSGFTPADLNVIFSVTRSVQFR